MVAFGYVHKGRYRHRAAIPRARAVLRKADRAEPDEAFARLGETADGLALAKLVAEYMKTPQAKGLTRPQAYAHLIQHDRDAIALWGGHRKQLALLDAMGDEIDKVLTEESDDVTTIADVMKKAATPEQVQKASRMVLESIAKREQQRNPGMSWDKAIIAATLSPEYSAAHRAEKELKFGPGF